MKTIEFDHLVDALRSLPSIGTKAAEKIAHFLIHQDKTYIDEFLSRILNAKTNVKFCKQCNNFSNDSLCDICNNDSRDNEQLCIISTIEDLIKIEQTNAFTGIYFILNDEIDVKTKKKIEPQIIKKLISYVNEKKFNEIIIATNFTTNGEATALFINKIIKELNKNCKVYRLAVGLPINSALDYADDFTLKSAIKNKTKYE